MIPAAFSTRFATLRQTTLVEGELFLRSKVGAVLRDLNTITIDTRIKAEESAYQKMHLGKYDSLLDLKDLVGATVVVLKRGDIPPILKAFSHADGIEVVGIEAATPDPQVFRYSEPKMYVRISDQIYLERRPELRDLVCEIRVTTGIQHALDEATHDFDYKGEEYEWERFRVVARLRAALELIDELIDRLDGERFDSNRSEAELPEEYRVGRAVQRAIEGRFRYRDDLPKDRKRLADTVASWLDGVAVNGEFGAELDQALRDAEDLVTKKSLDPTSVILGAIIRRYGVEALLANYDRKLLLSSELIGFLDIANNVPVERRVDLTF